MKTAKQRAKIVKWITVFLTVLTVYEQPEGSGKRKIGKLNGKEMSTMKKLHKHERTVIELSR